MNIKNICNAFKNNVIIMFVILISTAGVFAFTSCSNSSVTVPKLVGLTQESATKKLKSLGLNYNIEQLHSAEVDEGLIIAQSSRENSAVDSNTNITIIVSMGEQIYFPNLVGKSESDAKTILEDLGLVLAVSKREYSDKVQSGYVISQSAVAQKKANKGDIVSVVISKGEEKVSVPKLKGLSETSAKSKLSSSKLKSKAKYEYSSSVAKGRVIKQSVPSGEKVYKGTTITLTVSKGKKPAPKTSSASSYTTPQRTYSPPATTPPTSPPKTTKPPSTTSKKTSDFYVYIEE